MVLSRATLIADAFPRVLAIYFLLKEKENTGCPIILTMMSFPTDSYSYTLTSFFCNSAIDDMSQRRARWERWARSYLCTYLQKLKSNVELRHYGGWHCPQCSLFFRHLTAMSHMKCEFQLVVRYLIWMLLMGSTMIIVISSSWITSMSKQLLTPWQEFHYYIPDDSAFDALIAEISVHKLHVYCVEFLKLKIHTLSTEVPNYHVTGSLIS